MHRDTPDGGPAPLDPDLGGADRLAATVVAWLGAQPGAAPAGLGALAAAFERAGLGEAFASWIGPGPNRPVSAVDLERVLGAESFARLARTSGADPRRVAAGLAELLPRVIDRLTPDGVLAGSAASGAAAPRPTAGDAPQ